MTSVLLIEDDLWLADCYAMWLRPEGYQLRHVGDAQAAIDAIDDAVPDIILLDLLLPYANGIQLLHELQSHSDIKHIPVVICSGALPSQSVDLSQYGVVAVCDKASLNPQKLRQVIRRAL